MVLRGVGGMTPLPGASRRRGELISTTSRRGCRTSGHIAPTRISLSISGVHRWSSLLYVMQHRTRRRTTRPRRLECCLEEAVRWVPRDERRIVGGAAGYQSPPGRAGLGTGSLADACDAPLNAQVRQSMAWGESVAERPVGGCHGSSGIVGAGATRSHHRQPGLYRPRSRSRFDRAQYSCVRRLGACQGATGGWRAACTRGVMALRYGLARTLMQIPRR